MGDLEDLKESFEHLLYQQHSFTDGGFGGPERVVRASALSACRGRGSPPLIFQVTRFSCGGLAVGVSFNHILCDGRGAAQFLKGVGEIARGEAKFSIEAVWQREVLKCHVTFYKEI